MDDVLVKSGVYNLDENSSEEDFIKVGELVNCIGTVLIECYKE